MSFDLETVHSEMLEAIDDAYQKTPGFPAYDFTRAFALACQSLADDIELVEEHLNVENLEGVELDTFIVQHRGLYRSDASCATATLRIVSGDDGDIEIEIGDQFATESGVYFEAIEDGTYEVGDEFTVQAIEGGTIGNVAAETITVIPVTISGLGSVINDDAAEGGYDEESDDEYRERYYDDLANPGNGGNQAAYIAWATSISGVGRAKCFPQAYGDNTVEVCIIDSDMEPASATLIATVQDAIDPNENGDGAGLAPIGAVCTVTTATELSVVVSATLTIADGTTLSDVVDIIESDLTDYLRDEVAFEMTYVSYAQIGKIIATADGVTDYADLRLNTLVSNLSIGDRETPVLGTCTFTEAT